MYVLTPNGLEVPPDFPIAPYEAIFQGIRTRSAERPLWLGFSGAWNAVSFRFLDAAYYSDTLRDAGLQYGIGTSGPARYEEERALFGFFTNAVACIDAAYYGLSAAGAFLSPLYFRLIVSERQLKVNRAATCSAYAEAFPGDTVVGSLRVINTDGAFSCLRGIRNVLAHREAPGRTIYFSAGSGAEESPAEWNLLGIPLTSDALSVYRVGLARLLGELLESAAVFVSGHFKS